jgi:hypothetical protein
VCLWSRHVDLDAVIALLANGRLASGR